MIGEVATGPMRSPALLILLAATLLALPATAKVLAEGKPSKGFYWQKIEQKSGKVTYQCRATGGSKFQKQEHCESAGAVQPK
jgi:hypothetical protein